MSGHSVTDIWHDEADKLYAEMRGERMHPSGVYESELYKVEWNNQPNLPRPRKPKPINQAKRKAKRKLQRKARKANK